jgi:hypothetical protein
MEYLSIFGLMASPIIAIYLIGKSKIMEHKSVCFVVGILFSIYSLGAWVELQFLNNYLTESDDYFGLFKMMSIMQLPMIVAFWFWFYDKFIKQTQQVSQGN